VPFHYSRGRWAPERFPRNGLQVASKRQARELPNLSLPDALQLVHLYAERGSLKFEPAARRWLIRYLSEGTPSLRDVAMVTARLAERERD
jgi:hypothetical protein